MKKGRATRYCGRFVKEIRGEDWERRVTSHTLSSSWGTVSTSGPGRESKRGRIHPPLKKEEERAENSSLAKKPFAMPARGKTL